MADAPASSDDTAPTDAAEAPSTAAADGDDLVRAFEAARRAQGGEPEIAADDAGATALAEEMGEQASAPGAGPAARP